MLDTDSASNDLIVAPDLASAFAFHFRPMLYAAGQVSAQAHSSMAGAQVEIIISHLTNRTNFLPISLVRHEIDNRISRRRTFAPLSVRDLR